MTDAKTPSPFLTGRKLLLAVVVLSLSNFTVILDLTIANVSVPHIAGNLGISADQGTWIITSYAVAEAIFVPLTGWLAQRFGAVRCFTVSMLGFGLCSLICGLSPTLGILIAGRIGQGLCGGPLMPLTQTLLTRIAAPEKRSKLMGVWAMTTLVAPVMGPIVGGWISDNWSWHWIFFINIPVAITCAIAALAMLRNAETPTAKLPVDFIGLLLLIFWIGCLQIMLDIGRDHDWFASSGIVMLAIGALIGFAVFLIWELTIEHPIVDLRIFRHRGFTFGVLTLALSFGCYFASIVVIPQWLQASMGYTATWSGYTTALTGVSAVIAAPIVAYFLPKVDARFFIAGGVAWLGLFALARMYYWSSGADWWTLAWPQLFQGFGMPFLMMPVTILALNSVLPSETASAAGMQSFLRTIAIAVSTSMVLTVWSDDQRVARNEIVSNLQPDQISGPLGNAGFSMEQIRQVTAQIVDSQAAAQAMNHVFGITAVLLFLTAIFVLLAPRPSSRPVDTSAAH